MVPASTSATLNSKLIQQLVATSTFARVPKPNLSNVSCPTWAGGSGKLTGTAYNGVWAQLNNTTGPTDISSCRLDPVLSQRRHHRCGWGLACVSNTRFWLNRGCKYCCLPAQGC
eukprot:m.253245 g.253245  ORF g.253245 m.253245 type:complete len:114 (-) comp17534_c0_seq1:92-433(-)